MKEGKLELFKIQGRSFRVRRRRFARRATAILIAGLFVAANLLTSVKAAPGDLDPSFGNGGLVTTDFNEDIVEALAVQPDGKIVAAAGEGQPQFAWDLVRYNPDGSLDPTFGSGGKLTTTFPNQIESQPRAVTIQPDGKILVGGEAAFPANCVNCFDPQAFALARYNADGTLDPSFGSGGLATLLLPLPSEIESLAVQPDGRIVAGGVTFEPLPVGHAIPVFALIRLNPDGSPDLSFGLQGVVMTDFFRPAEGAIQAIALQTDGRIVASGWIFGPGPAQSPGFCVVRYNNDGSLDGSFGVGGIVITQLSMAVGGGISILSDGRILVGGGAGNYAAVARYNTDGSLDATFGTAGIAFAPFPGRVMTVLPSGRIIVAGTYEVPPVPEAFSVTRFDADGSLDSTFGSSGNVKTETALFQNPIENAVVPYGKDKVIVGGGVTNPSGLGLARYLGDLGAAGAAGAAADLGVKMSSSLSSDANGNSLITYTIAVANNGPDDSYYVTLSDDVPPGTVFESLSIPPDWVVYSEPAVGRPGPISVSRSLLGGRSTDPSIFTLVVRVTQHHRAIPNHVSISSSSTADPNGSNNQAHTVTRVP